MAKRTDAASGDDPDAVGPDPAQETPEEAGKGGGRKPLVVLMLVLVPALAGAGLAFLQYPRLASAALAIGLDFGEAEEDVQDKPVEYGEFAKIEDLVINPAGTSGKRYLLADIGLESRDSKTLAELTEKDIVVRDTILKVLGSHTVDELASLTYRTELKRHLLDAVNAVLQTGEVERMYFTEYVLQ